MKKTILFVIIICFSNIIKSQNIIQCNQTFKPKKQFSVYNKLQIFNSHSTNLENYFHIGPGASGFTYVLWPVENNKISTLPPYIGFSYMPEVTMSIGNRVAFYVSVGWTGMSEFYNMYYDQAAATIPPTRVDRAPVVGMTGISFAVWGYEDGKDVYLGPCRFSLGAGYGNFKWDLNSNNYVQGVIGVISLEWYIFLVNL